MTEKENDDLTYGIQYVNWLLDISFGAEHAMPLKHLYFSDLPGYLRRAWLVLINNLEDQACQSQKPTV